MTPSGDIRTWLPGLLGIALVLNLGFPVPREAAAQQPDSASVARFQLAESFLRSGQFDRAINILEQLYETQPRTFVFFSRLKQAYESTKRYEDAIRLLDEQIAREPLPVTHMADRGRLRYLQGDEEGAMADLQRAIDIAPDRPSSYAATYQILVQLRLFEQAVDFMETGRTELQDDALFRRELGYLYGLLGDHGRAMQEYVGLLAGDERQLGVVRSRITRTGLSDAVVEQSIPVVEKAVRSTPLNRSYRELLAWLYEEAGDYSKALDVNRAIDRLEGEQGRVLFTFAARAVNADAFEAARDAYHIILDRYPDSVIAPEAARGIGQLHVEWAEALGERPLTAEGEPATTVHYDAALQAYMSFAEAHPNHGLYPFVMLDMARIQQNVFVELNQAHTLYSEIVRRFPNHPAANDARFELGQIDITRDRLVEARLIFQRLEDDLRIGEQAELARLQIALVHFYSGEFEAAMTILEAMEENTSTDVANDAIELKVLLFENKGPDSLDTPLRRFAEASLRFRQRRLAESDTLLQQLARDAGMHPLNDDADFLRARIEMARGNYEDAVALLGEIPLKYPNSYLSDRSLYEAARVFEEHLANPDRALELYTRLMTEFPGSLLVSQARSRIRELRGDGV